MKTGLLTFYHIHHYGAMLQAYATERAVASLGSECEIIAYYVNQDNTLFQRPTGLGSAAHDAHTALHYGPLKARYERVEAYSRENLNISGRRYQSREELRQAELPSAAVIIGSEGQGICRELFDAAQGKIIIPMSPRCESLNAAVAAAIVLWQMKR